MSQTTENIAVYTIHQLKKYNHSCAIKHKNIEISGNQLANKILSIGQHLNNIGVKPSDVVATEINSPIDHLAGTIAIALVGATSLAHPKSTPDEKIKGWDRRVNTKWLLHDSETTTNGQGSYTRIGIKDVSQKTNITTESISIKKPNAPWLIATGSGSTGQPKLMPISHLQQIERCRISERRKEFMNSHTTYTSLVAIYFYTGIAGILNCFPVGAKANLVSLTSDIATHNIDETTIIYATPLHAKQLIKLKREKPELLPNLKAVILAGDLIREELRAEAQKTLCENILVMYGCNETGGCCIAGPPIVYKNSELIGRAINGYTIEIVDENHKKLPTNRIGQIRIKSSCNIIHYLNDKKATENSFRYGYFYPGDLGLVDENNLLYFKGRKDGMLLFNGINIHPLEIEKCLLSHSNINDVAVTSLKHETHGDIPIALVQLINPNINTSEKELKEFASARLEKYYINQIIIAQSIPRNESGKLPKEDLKKIVMQHFSKNIQQPSLLSIGKVIGNRKLSEGRFCSAIPESSESEVKHSYQLINSILDTKLKPSTASKDPTIKMARLACELTIILFEAANIPCSVQPTFVPLKEPKEQKQVYLLHFHQFPSGIEQAFTNTLHAAFNLLYSLRMDEITERQTQTIRKSIKGRINKLHALSSKMQYGKSSLTLIKYALKTSIPIIYLSNGWIQYGWGRKSITMLRSGTLRDSAIGVQASNDKFATAMLLRELGFPVPQHYLATTKESAVILSKTFNWPVVIKPNDGERGEGVTTGVKSATELLQAFNYAAQYSKRKRILIEETIPGICHRIFIANGKLIYCVKRNPIGVYGNGKDSIEKLVTDCKQSSHNNTLHNTNNHLPEMDSIAFKTLKDAGFKQDLIPALDEFVALRPIETTEWGGVDEECTDQIHEDNVELAIQVCESFYLSICGVDIISNDISVPWHKNGAKINEINYQPLIGGGDASLRSLPKLFGTILNKDASIPIHIFIGAENSHKRANDKHQDLIKSHKRGVYLVNAQSIESPNRKIIHQELPSLYKNLTRCLINKNCSEIILVIDSNDILWTGLPINQCESLEICDTNLNSWNNMNEFSSDYEYEFIKQELLSLLRPGKNTKE